MAADDDRVELETSDLLQLRKDFRDLVNSMVDSNTHHEDDRKASKKELDGVSEGFIIESGFEIVLKVSNIVVEPSMV